MLEEERFIAEEHPEGDKYQLMMMGVFLAIWITDSFIVKATLFTVGPWYQRTAVGLLVLVFGAYLVNESHKLVIASGEPVFIEWGVYSWARHPMYLGIMLVYLGLTISTASVASMVILVGIFYVYDRIAGYEESRIIEKLGEKYLEYLEKTRRWIIL
jgi:protein-S-isoprenylcysteine O-methyltransferase Ste14